ncbi:MAG: glycosyltransferase family 2 protein [Chloroflexota bacterium]|nr:glycosyltransferase family 2 protein [Chloroflexota bacterium]MDQ5866488.1 glycosyltransferase family 2 protein [Chloroflexota bacterium]
MTRDHNTTNLSITQPFASIVVVSYNTAEHIEGCLRSLLALDYPRSEIIVVDNGSTDGSMELVRSRFPEVEPVELGENKGFAGAASVGMFMSKGDILVTVNPDVQLDPQWMSAVVEAFEAFPDAGVVGSKILYPDRKTLQHAGGVVHYPLATTDHIGRGEPDTGQYDHSRVVSFVTGAALAMRRDVGHSLNFFDESYYPVFFEDVDLCWRAKREGWRVVYQPAAVAYHNESVTYDRRSSRYYSYFHANRLRFVVKHYTPEQVMLDFLPAEAERLVGDMEREDRTASLSLLDNKLPDGYDNYNNEPNNLIARKWDDLQRQIDEVMASWQVYEKSHPRKPRKGIAGKLSNMFSRLYTWPVLRKQIDYNASLARSLREISRQLADLQARVAVQSILASGLVSRQNVASTNVYAELDALRSRIEELESANMATPINYGQTRND